MSATESQPTAIGYFQLESLIITRSPFLFISLQECSVDSAKVMELLKIAKQIDESNLLAHLQTEQVPLEYPIVLVCENGAISTRAALSLEKNSYTNVYVVEGGILNLLKES